MTAQIAGFVSRAEAGLRAPRSVSRNIDAARGGLAVHYGGAAGPPADHAGCVARWRSWQAYHLDGRGWADIAYSFGFCDHGYVLAGRGLGIWTAANGTNDGNDRFLAACWVGGGDATPSPAAYDALDWITAEVRRNGVGREVRPHQYFKSTGCPGTALTARAGQLHGTDIGAPAPAPVPAQATAPAPSSLTGHDARRPTVRLIDLRNAHRSHVRAPGMAALQRLIDTPDDGVGGPATREALGRAQARAGVTKDYIFGPETAEALLAGKAG